MYGAKIEMCIVQFCLLLNVYLFVCVIIIKIHCSVFYQNKQSRITLGVPYFKIYCRKTKRYTHPFQNGGHKSTFSEYFLEFL